MRVMNKREEVRYKQLLRMCNNDHTLLEKAFSLAKKDNDGDIQFKEIVEIIRRMFSE